MKSNKTNKMQSGSVWLDTMQKLNRPVIILAKVSDDGFEKILTCNSNRADPISWEIICSQLIVDFVLL